VSDALRLDKWLWHARFARRREGAVELVIAGRVRVNGEVVSKTHRRLRPGDVVTVVTAREVQMVRVVELAARRGSAHEAQALYERLAG
jgi:ribosome-associated heat shock protein Hsp15